MSHPPLCASNKFLHVVYEYRYFALAGRAWKQFGPLGTSEAQQEANGLLPGICVLFQDSLLMHARLLIDFYTKNRRYDTDILLEDFSLPAIGDTLKDRLKEFKEPIEVHVLHMSIWRDADYRTANRATPNGIKCKRIDSNVKSILDNTSVDFPPELLEKDNVIAYLNVLGLD